MYLPSLYALAVLFISAALVPLFLLPDKYLEKNSFFDETKEEIEEFEFNQDIENESGINSPGWLRYQKRIK